MHYFNNFIFRCLNCEIISGELLLKKQNKVDHGYNKIMLKLYNYCYCYYFKS